MKRDSCYFCSETECLEKHHIVPRRFNGSNKEENLVVVCSSCHSKIESLYDKRFYDKLRDSLSAVVSVSDLETMRDATINILSRSCSERMKGFLYGLEFALGVDKKPWSKRSESFVTVEFANKSEVER